VAPLDVSLRMKLIALLNTIKCNSQPAFTKSFLVGIGTTLPLWVTYGLSWSSATTGLKFYQPGSAASRQELLEGNSDFGVTVNGVPTSYYAQVPDVGLLPAVALGIVPGN
jgi:hypothetical protein